MAFTAKRVVIVATSMADRTGLLAEVLGALRDAGVNLYAAAAWVKDGQAFLEAVPEDLAKLRQVAMRNGVSTTEKPAIYIEGDDETGALLPAVQKIAAAGVSMTGALAVAGGGKFGAVLETREADYEKACAALGI